MKARLLLVLMALSITSCAGVKSARVHFRSLDVETFAKFIERDDVYVVDVRTPEEYNEGHIEGARLLNVMDEETFLAGIDSLSPEHTYYIYCRSGRRSQKAAMHMTQRGLKVVDLQGGYNAWKESGSKAGE